MLSIHCAITTHSVNLASFGLHCFICSLHVLQAYISLENIPIRIIGIHYTLMKVHCVILPGLLSFEGICIKSQIPVNGVLVLTLGYKFKDK